jgi:serine/threonine protein kinase
MREGITNKMIGKTLGNCQIIEELGRGGMAVVYRAYQPSLNRYVAIKILPPQYSLDRQFIERFQREAKAAAGLRHPNIVVIHDVGHQEGIYYIVMELLEGQTLKQLIEREGRLSSRRVARIVEQVATALDYAHERGFVHRDVKPSNIFVGKDDHITLADFGIAKAASETQHLTREGTLMGTPEYMSPEQAEGGKVDRRTDLYALGVVLYQMLVGRVPFRGTTPHAVLHSVIYDPPPSPRQINANLSPAVESVILKAVAKRPGQRFQRGQELAAALRASFAQKRPVAAVPAPPPPAIPTPRRGSRPPARAAQPRPTPVRERSPLLLWIMAGIAGVLVLMLAVLLVVLATEDGADETPIPTFTQVSIWSTPTPEEGVVSPTSMVADTSAPPPTTEVPPTKPPDVPTDTPLPPTDTSPPPTNTPKPPTNTPKPPTPPPPPTTPPPPTCSFPAQGLFAGLWQTYKNKLGCPLYQYPKVIQDAEQAFDNGHMFWREDNEYIYVVYEKGGLNGTYQAFKDTWTQGVDPEYTCAASPPPGRVQPRRGFGKVWCNNLGAQGAAIGWAFGLEEGFWAGKADPTIQDFERGVIFRDSDGQTHGLAYVLFADNGTFVRVGY